MLKLLYNCFSIRSICHLQLGRENKKCRAATRQSFDMNMSQIHGALPQLQEVGLRQLAGILVHVYLTQILKHMKKVAHFLAQLLHSL